jgi:flagellar biosynthesis chaperone FliJ
MNRRDVQRFDRLRHVREVEEQRARQDLVAAHERLRLAIEARDAVRADAVRQRALGLCDLVTLRTDLMVGALRSQRLRAAQDMVTAAESGVTLTHDVWSAAARRVEGLDKIVERRREAMRDEQLRTESRELEDLFLARRAMGLT